MAYFDSAKNRALWQKELDHLRKERADRELSGSADSGKKKESGTDKPGRVRITYAQLEREVNEAARDRSSKKAEYRKEKSAEHSAREREPEVRL